MGNSSPVTGGSSLGASAPSFSPAAGSVGQTPNAFTNQQAQWQQEQNLVGQARGGYKQPGMNGNAAQSQQQNAALLALLQGQGAAAQGGT